jgi:hypothetical protein
MDPNANLREQLRSPDRILNGYPGGGAYPDLEHDADRLAELVDALHTWIIGGGALPDRWQTRTAKGESR